MSEAFAALPSDLDALAATAWTLEPQRGHDRNDPLCDQAAWLVDGLLTRVARGRGALDVAIGEGLAALAVGDRVLRLGYSGVGAYARERLGIAGSTALKMARLARELRDRPALCAAVRRGEISARKAETVLPVARGEAEEGWVARAQIETVRALQAAVKAVVAGEPEDDEPWERICVSLSPQERARLDEAMALAGKVLGATAPTWQRLEAICAEFLGAHPVEAPDEDGPDVAGLAREPVIEQLESAKEALEHEMRQWGFLEKVKPVAAPDGSADGKTDPWLVDEELRRLSKMRERWDEVFGHLAMILRMTGLWRHMGFASFGHYAAERLGMAERTVAQRASLALRLYSLPALGKAMREGRISYEKARLVAAAADDASVAAWIDRAEKLPCISLRREIDAHGEKQMCARKELDLRVPRRVGSLLAGAFRAAREAAGTWLEPGECLERIAGHFIDTWKDALSERNTVQKRALARDRGYCQVPGCSRAAVHAHHVLFRSFGGGDEPANLVSICAAHHLHGVHMGWIRVRGRAPDGLTWELGVRRGAPPLAVFSTFAAAARRGRACRHGHSRP